MVIGTLSPKGIIVTTTSEGENEIYLTDFSQISHI